MIDVMSTVPTRGSEDVTTLNHDITLYRSPESPPERVAMHTPLSERGFGTSDGGRLVGWYGPGHLMWTATPPEAWRDVVQIVSVQREMVERITAINAALKRIQEHLVTVERAQAEQTSVDIAPHLSALTWIKAATSLPDSRVAALLGVTRQALVRWRRGEPIAASKRRHLLAVRDVLERAAQCHPPVEALGAWLDTPQGPDARTPSDLLAQGEFDKARLLAVTQASGAVVAPPEWAREAGTTHPRRDARTHQGLPPWYEDDIAEQDDETEPDVFVRLNLDEA